MYGVNGLILVKEYLSPVQHDYLVGVIERGEWDNTLSRRTQHYGWRYDYKSKSVSRNDWLGELPASYSKFAKQIATDFGRGTPDQVIVNEYTAGQGIGDHVDCLPCFGDVIYSVSLLSPVVMEFKHETLGYVPLWLEPRSLLMISGPARHEWTHGIPKRQIDDVLGLVSTRSLRYSLTLRTVIRPVGRE
jgi:alkylated DNA repair dioxygenase AlkB